MDSQSCAQFANALKSTANNRPCRASTTPVRFQPHRLLVSYRPLATSGSIKWLSPLSLSLSDYFSSTNLVSIDRSCYGPPPCNKTLVPREILRERADSWKTIRANSGLHADRKPPRAGSSRRCGNVVASRRRPRSRARATSSSPGHKSNIGLRAPIGILLIN